MYEIQQLKVGTLIKNYCYVIIDKLSREAAVVDPSWEVQPVNLILQKYNAELKSILLTHSHFDHVNMVKPLLNLHGPNVYMSTKEINYYGYTCGNLIPVEHRDVIKIGDTNIHCLLTPGHTAGSMCYLLQNSLFTGDTVFTEGCGMCDSWGGDAGMMYESIQMIKAEVHPDVKVYPGHSYGKSPGYTMKQLMTENIYFQILDKEYFIEFRMRKKQGGLFGFK
jgi:glyoxylase-like metal-dependent hydrolase (beta-lactamase superfamily II)